MHICIYIRVVNVNIYNMCMYKYTAAAKRLEYRYSSNTIVKK